MPTCSRDKKEREREREIEIERGGEGEYERERYIFIFIKYKYFPILLNAERVCCVKLFRNTHTDKHLNLQT